MKKTPSPPPNGSFHLQYIKALKEAFNYYTNELPANHSAILKATNKIKKSGITSNESLKDSGSLIAKIRKEKVMIEAYRKCATKFLKEEDLKWVILEKNITAVINKCEKSLLELNASFIKSEQERIDSLTSDIIQAKNRKLKRAISEINKNKFYYESEKAIVIANIEVELEIEANNKLQAIERIPGRKKTVAQISENVDWQTIVELYIAKNGPFDLKFLMDFLAIDQPEIRGIYYKEVIINVNRS